MFLFTRNAEGTGDRSPWGDFWFQPVGMQSSAGVRVTPDTSMQLTAVYACVRNLSESFAILPPVLYRQQGRKKAVVTDHWLWKLLNRQPNRYQNAFQWREMLQGHLALRGNAYCFIVANSRGVITELMPIHPDSIALNIANDGSFTYTVKDREGNERTYPRTDIWHLKGLSPDIYRGYNPIEIARDAVGIGLAAQRYGGKFFANDARPTSGWIEFPGQFKDQEQRKAFQETWQQGQGGQNRGKAAVLDRGMKYHELGITNADSQFLETRKFQVEDIARLFRMPPHMIGELSRSTNNNIEHQSLEFVTHTLQPWAERWEAAIECDLLGDTDLQIEFDFTNLLRGDAESRSTYYHNGILDGWLLRNEARAMESLDPLDGLDEPLRPLNMVPESDAEKETDEAETLEKTQPEPPEAPEKPED